MAVYTTINDPGVYFNTVLWTGNDTTATAITGVGFQPDMTWIKERSEVRSHVLFDVVRGAEVQLNPNDSASDATVAESLQSFDADGFTVGDATSVNKSGETYVGWNWKETADAGFDIVGYTGNETARTIAHSLSAVPKMIIAKDRDDGSLNWFVGHASLGWTKRLKLDGTNDAGTNTVWNDTDPTSDVFSVGSSTNANKSGDAIIAYLWAEKQGFSKFGSYTGNGSTTSNFVYLGFKPAWLMLKNTASTQPWLLFNNKSFPFNGPVKYLHPNNSDAEASITDYIDLLSNGFCLTDNSAYINSSGVNYIYMAVAEAPLVNSEGVPCNAR
jgi:hypothetical protein